MRVLRYSVLLSTKPTWFVGGDNPLLAGETEETALLRVREACRTYASERGHAVDPASERHRVWEHSACPA